MMNDSEVIKKKILYTEWRMQYVAKILEDVNATDRYGRTALHRACEEGDEMIIAILLKHGADLNVLTHDEEETPAHLAVKNGHLKILQLLLRHCDINKKMSFLNAKTKTTGSTALHLAVKIERLDIVKCLLNNYATYVATDNNGKKPVELTTNVAIVEFFELIDEIFESIKKADPNIVTKLKSLKRDDLLAVGNAGNDRSLSILPEISSSYIPWYSHNFLVEAFRLIDRATESALEEYELTIKRSNRNQGY